MSKSLNLGARRPGPETLTSPADRFLRGAIVGLCALWILVLMGISFFDRKVFVLHVFQSLLYAAVIAFTLKGRKWGYAVGVTIALIWNGYNLSAGTVFGAGFRVWGGFLRGAGVEDMVLFLAPPLWFAHLALVLAIAFAYARRTDRRRSDVVGFLVGAAATVAYFAAIIGLFGTQFVQRLLAFIGLAG
jgi:hypothetical protein